MSILHKNVCLLFLPKNNSLCINAKNQKKTDSETTAVDSETTTLDSETTTVDSETMVQTTAHQETTVDSETTTTLDSETATVDSVKMGISDAIPNHVGFHVLFLQQEQQKTL